MEKSPTTLDVSSPSGSSDDNIDDIDIGKVIEEAKLYLSLLDIIETTHDEDLKTACSILLNKNEETTPNTLIEIVKIFLLKGYVYIVKSINEISSIINNNFLKEFSDYIIYSKTDISYLGYTFFYLFDSNISPYYFTKNKDTTPETKRNVGVFFSLWTRRGLCL